MICALDAERAVVIASQVGLGDEPRRPPYTCQLCTDVVSYTAPADVDYFTKDGEHVKYLRRAHFSHRPNASCALAHLDSRRRRDVQEYLMGSIPQRCRPDSRSANRDASWTWLWSWTVGTRPWRSSSWGRGCPWTR